MSTEGEQNNAQTDDAGASQDALAGSASLLADLAVYWQSLMGLLEDLLELASLEGRLAALSAVRMLTYGIAAAVLGLTSWFALVAALAVWLYHKGYSLESILLGISLSSAVLAIVLGWLIRRLSGNLAFSATRRKLLPPTKMQQESHE